jgi:hypothetical protein
LCSDDEEKNIHIDLNFCIHGFYNRVAGYLSPLQDDGEEINK